MAAYAAVVSLMNNMEQINNHPRISTCFHEKQMESLDVKVRFLLNFMETYNSDGDSKEAHDLESQIASAAHGAEDVIESHVVDLLLSGKSSCSLLDLQRVIKGMECIQAKVMEAKENWGSQSQQEFSHSSPRSTAGKQAMVGFEEELIQLMDLLTSQQSTRQIFTITGMGGLGKTTLARTAYHNLLISQNFDIRAWATISQEYNVLGILLQLLSPQNKSTNRTVHELGTQLYKRLCGRRYLIVLDDVWSDEVWDKMKFFFPDNGNRSRVVITSRLEKVGDHCGSCCFRKKFLEEDVSWILFRETVFGEGQSCPPELEEMGREIVRQCRGLPLSITVMGGLLQKSRTTVYWKNVAENLNSVLSSREEDCLNILSLSYTHLPVHLKPCFLYLGAFREDSEIHISKIIKLWVAEGFIKPNGAQVLEDIAKGYVVDLIDRNLVLVGRRRGNGRIKTFRIHDLLRELCLKICEKEKFWCVLSELGTPPDRSRERRLVFHGHNKSQVFLDALQSASLARSLISKVDDVPVIFRMLRILSRCETGYPESIFQNFLNLRYLRSSFRKSITFTFTLPSSMSLIWNLQTLILKCAFVQLMIMPLEIWKMAQLRHINCINIHLPDPPPSDDLIVLRNLQTLLQPVNLVWSEEVSKRIPNIRRLSLRYRCDVDGQDSRLHYHLHNLCGLRKLSSLTIIFPRVKNPSHPPVHYSLSVYVQKENLRFPYSLSKLTLANSHLHWPDLTIIIGSLPHLQVLKLYSVLGREWSLVDGQFPRLKFLQVMSCDISCWNAESCHFPVLEKLYLRRLKHLKEIPLGIGDILTLQLISVDTSSMSAAVSAVKIKEEQDTLGNDGLQIDVLTGELRTRERFMERVEAEGLSLKDIQLD